MSEEWADVQLAELVDIKHGYAFKGEYFTDEQSGAVLLSPGNFAIGGGFQFNKLKFYKDGGRVANVVEIAEQRAPSM